MIKRLTLSLIFFFASIFSTFSYGQMISHTDAFSIMDCSNGQATFLQASNYSAPEYSWYWYGGGGIVQNGGVTATYLCPYDYSFHLDSLGIEIYSEDFTIGSTDPCLGLHVSSFGWLPTAPGGCTGYMNSDIAGGTVPYTYTWNMGATTQNIFNLCAGTYTLTVHDSLGCSDDMSLTIGVDSSLSANLVSLPQSWPSQADTCNGSAGTSTTGGVAPYTYHWNTGATTPYINGLCPGDYSVTVYDAAGDSVVLNYTIGIACQGFTIASLNVSPTYDSACSGSIFPDVIGGTQPYFYNWSNDMMGAGFSHDASVSNLCFGSYSLQVFDSLGCLLSDSIQIVVGIPTITANLNTAMDWAGNCTGTAEVSPQGGLEPYTISWSNGETTTAVDDLCPGIYSVVIADAYGTTATFPFAITDSSSTYGNDPYGDSTAVGDLYDYLIENCTIDYSNIDSASLSAAVYDSVSQNLYLTWEIFNPSGTVYLNDTIGFDGGNGVYNITVTVFCPQKSTGNYMSIHGQIYMQGDISFVAIKENELLNIQAFPNPFNAEFTISLSETGNYSVLLNDALGRTIYADKFEQTNQFVIHPDVTISNGSYFLIIESATGKTVLKLVH